MSAHSNQSLPSVREMVPALASQKETVAA